MMPQPVYLDHAATTPVREEVLAAMMPFFGPRFGNPSSVHRWGRDAHVALDEARERVAACLGANADEVCFTSGGTEGDNFAILGAWRALRASGRTAAVTTPIEHKAVLAAVHQVAEEGGEERIVRVDADGRVDAAHYAALLGAAPGSTSAPDAQVAVASIMWVNNEVGVIQDVPTFAAMAKAAGAIFHTDAVQAFGKVAVDARVVPFDLATISGHKLGAPKGIGALYIRRGTPLAPMFHGGSQDRGRRPGTENVAYAVALATACELTLAEHAAEHARLEALRQRFEALLREQVPDVVIHASGVTRAPHIANVSIPGTSSESMLMALDLRGIACSAGSACQSGSVSASHVLSAMGVSPDLAAAALRFSFGGLSTDDQVEQVVNVLATLAAKGRGARGASTAFAAVEF